MSGVKQEFSATGDDKVANAYRKLAAENEGLLRSNEKLTQQTRELHEQVKKMAADLDNLTGRRLQQLEAEIRKTQELKRARQELIVTTNWTHARTGPSDGRGMTRTSSPNWTYAAPPSPMRLGYRGDATRDLVPARHPYFTMEDADIPRLGYRGDPSGLSTLNQPPPALTMADPFTPFFGKQMKVVAAMTAGLIGVDALIQAFNQRLQDTLQRQADAASAQKSIAAVEGELITNISDPVDREKARRAMWNISEKYGLDPRLVGKTLARQGGRGSELTIEQKISAAEQAGALTRLNPDQYEALAGATQQTMRFSENPGDAEWALSLMSKAGEQAFPGDPALQARMMQQAVSGMMANVPNPTNRTLEQAAEIVTSLSQAGGEERGEEARTASIRIQNQISEFIERRGAWQSVSPYTGKPMRGLKPRNLPYDPVDFFKTLRSDKKTSQQFWDKFSAEAHYEGIIRSWQDPNSKASQILAENEAKIFADRESLTEKKIAFERGSERIITTNKANQSEVRALAMDANATIEARRNEARSIRDRTLKQTGQWPGGSLLMEAIDYVGRGFADVAGGPDIESRALVDLQRRRHGWNINAYEQSNPEAKAAAALLDSQIKRLEEIRDEIKALRRGDASKSPSSGPAMNGQFGRGNER